MVLAGESEPLGQGVEHLAELQSAQHGLQVDGEGDRQRGGAASVSSVAAAPVSGPSGGRLTAKWLSSRAKPPSDDVAGRGRDAPGRFGGPLQHPGDQTHVASLGFEGLGAGVVDAAGP